MTDDHLTNDTHHTDNDNDNDTRTILKALDEEYQEVLLENQIEWLAIQRSVRQSAFLSTVFMCVYLSIGCWYFGHTLDWSIRDSLMFAVYTITTVGYGYHEIPDEREVQLFVIVYTFVGIAAVTTLLSQAYQFVKLEANRVGVRVNFSSTKTLDVTPSASAAAAVVAASCHADHPQNHSNKEDHKNESLSSNALNSVTQNDKNDIIDDDDNKNNRLDARTSSNSSSNSRASNNDDGLNNGIHVIDEHSISYLFGKLVASVKKFLKYDKYGKVVKFFLPFFGQWFFGAIVVGSIEGWGAVESLYWAAVSLTTVGYGDLYPTKNASIWFCIFYLPVSLGFLSFFLANVANLYIKLHHKNTVRIERTMRAKIAMERRKARSEIIARNFDKGNYLDNNSDQDGECNNDTNMVDRQRSSSLSSIGDDVNDSNIIPQDYPLHIFGTEEYKSGIDNSMMNFAALPTGDIVKGRRSNNIFIGRSDGGQHYRDRVTFLGSVSSNRFNDTNASKDESANYSITTMKSLIDVIQSRERLDNASSVNNLSSPSDISLGVTSDNVIFRSENKTQPSFAVRVKIQERLARIVAIEVCGYHSRAEIKDNIFSMSFRGIRDIMDKWIIPNRARDAFRAVAYDAIFYVGERNLIIEGPNALFALSPREFQGLFSPVLASIGDEDAMQSWLLATNLMADVELKGPGENDDPLAVGILT